VSVFLQNQASQTNLTNTNQTDKSFVRDGVEYVFDYNISDILKVPIDNPQKIKELIGNASAISIAVNTTNATEIDYFKVVSFNLVNRLTIYFTTQNRVVPFSAVSLGGELNNTHLLNTTQVILLLGPSSAQNTSVYINSMNWIVIQGTDYHNLNMAGDRLALLIVSEGLY
jgi:hypothetical protein